MYAKKNLDNSLYFCKYRSVNFPAKMQLTNDAFTLKNMDLERAAEGYAALSTDVRLSILRLLARAGADGLASGEIARKLGVPANSLSQQLFLLSAARLVHHEREGRNVFYKIDLDAIKWLIKFLAVDCAAGRLKGVKIDG